MRWIYISPHLDDAVLSAGGLIYEQTRAGMQVEIWTFMCGFPPSDELSPFAQMLHQQWGISAAAEVVTARRAEDVNAACKVGAKTVHFDYLDCIYRRGKNGEWLYSDIFAPPHEDDVDLPARIAEAISTRLKPDDKLVGQLALGSHLDHVLVRRAVESLKRPVFYDVDIPYLFNFPDEFAPKTAGMKETVHSVTESGLASWQDAIASYTSQMGMLFESPEAMCDRIRQYWSEINGIRLWSFE
ncbi:MAG TPA: PIG-L family deacetylase [Anaerolineales bacterium]|nr:PIG-L family deacetylase [Anaerolineales bacterium]